MTEKPRRILLASGGTGGHFYPGLALANELRKKGGWEILFLVKKDDLAVGTLAEQNYPYAETDMIFLPRSANPLAHAAFLWKLLRSVFLCLKILKDFKPVLVFGAGSYVSFPAVLAAALKGLPSLIHESNAKFGLANRLCAMFASKTALGLPVENNPFNAKSELTGTPIRDSFAIRPDGPAMMKKFGLKDGAPVMLVFGGSQGAKRINRAAANAVKTLNKKNIAFQAVHVTGKKDNLETLALYSRLGLEKAPFLRVLDYYEDINELYSVCDLVFCRSGAGTVAELLHLKKPAVLIPFPSSAGGHQLRNAKVLSDAGAAMLLEESPAFEERFLETAEELLKAPATLAEMKNNFSRLDLPGSMRAAANISAAIEKLVSKQ
ncbi:MAG: undecaprenyldiphospho-muramoylpentapeptide beta-N-acetylglucosaminyltransferase [Elusimicrobia bacterium]|nr:undecaprenyldiphospho-muramoylpentapeptide beta-N-acetylglucosaminyltransferase [Elusimicrobiota bacterium]